MIGRLIKQRNRRVTASRYALTPVREVLLCIDHHALPRLPQQRQSLEKDSARALERVWQGWGGEAFGGNLNSYGDEMDGKRVRILAHVSAPFGRFRNR